MTQPAAPAPDDPYANKAVVAAIGTLVTVALRWAVSDDFSLNDEGIVAIAGAITTVAVYAVSNYRRILGLKRDDAKAVVANPEPQPRYPDPTRP